MDKINLAVKDCRVINPFFLTFISFPVMTFESTVSAEVVQVTAQCVPQCNGSYLKMIGKGFYRK